MTPSRERSPVGNRGASESAGRPDTTVPPASDTDAEARHAIEHAAEIRRVLRGDPWRRHHHTRCGCPVDDHGCSRAELHEAVLSSPFPSPRLVPADELLLINRVRVDQEFAEATLRRFTELLGDTT